MTSSTTRSKAEGPATSSRSSAASPLSTTSASNPSASRLKRSPSARWSSSSTIRTRWVSGTGCLRQKQRECASVPRASTLGKRAAPVLLRHRPDDEQSEPTALGANRQRRGTVEAAEDPLQLLVGNAYTAVRHPHGHPFVVDRFERDLDIQPGRRVLHGVIEQI